MSISDQGWQIIEFSPESKQAIGNAILTIRQRLSTIHKIHMPLEFYAMEDDAHHEEIQVDIANFFIAQGYGREIISQSLPIFKKLLGQDLHIQKYPYFRIARPGKAQDNIGIHRDTKYGGTPYECSVVMPLTYMPPDGSLHVIDGSNIQSEAMYPFQSIDTGIQKNSDKHNLGFLYSQKRLNDNLPTHPVDVKVGQGLIFPLSLVHGQEINRSDRARFSVDIRLVNSMAPIEWSHTVHADYWEGLCVSPVTKQARNYYEAQK